MEDLDHNKILQAPGLLMFFMFINTLIGEKKAKFSDISNQAVLLNSEASNYFILGRDDYMNPFIGIQESMVPWFLEMPWDKVALCPKDKYIYLIADEKKATTSTFVLGLKPRSKRMITLFDPKNEDINKVRINIKIFKIIKNDIAVSHNNAASLKVQWCNGIHDIIEEEIKKETLKTEENDEFVIIRRK